MKPDISYKHNGITLDRGKYHIAYGEEQADPFTGEWRMIIYKNNKEITFYTNSELLEEAQGERPVDLVLAGMVKYFMK